MESFIVERGEAREFAGGCGASETSARNACTQQEGAGKEWLAHYDGLCPCDFCARRSKTCDFKNRCVFDGVEENFTAKEAERDIQNEMKSYSESYPTKKIACLQ